MGCVILCTDPNRAKRRFYTVKADRNKLELALARACMTPETLTAAAEMPRPTVNNVITGRSVRPATLGRIARALGVDVADIIKKEG